MTYPRDVAEHTRPAGPVANLPGRVTLRTSPCSDVEVCAAPSFGSMLAPCQLELWEAGERGDLAGVQRALEQGASSSERNRPGWNALHRVAMSGSLQCVAATACPMTSRGMEPRSWLNWPRTPSA